MEGGQRFSARRQKEPSFEASIDDPCPTAERIDIMETWKPSSTPRRGQPVLPQRDRDPLQFPEICARKLVPSDSMFTSCPPIFPNPRRSTKRV